MTFRSNQELEQQRQQLAQSVPPSTLGATRIATMREDALRCCLEAQDAVGPASTALSRVPLPRWSKATGAMPLVKIALRETSTALLVLSVTILLFMILNNQRAPSLTDVTSGTGHLLSGLTVIGARTPKAASQAVSAQMKAGASWSQLMLAVGTAVAAIIAFKQLRHVFALHAAEAACVAYLHESSRVLSGLHAAVRDLQLGQARLLIIRMQGIPSLLTDPSFALVKAAAAASVDPAV